MSHRKNRLVNFLWIFLFLIFIQKNAYAADNEPGFWSKVWGTTGPTTLYGVMWTYHITSRDQSHDNNNPALAFATHGLFIGTFLNSFGVQSYAFGIQRFWLKKPLPNDFDLRLGYRLGLIYGYKNTPGDLGMTDHQPFIPFPQLIAEFTWHNAGIQLSTTGKVASAMLLVNL